MEQREHGRFLRRVRQRTRDRDRRMAAPPAGGTGSAKEPDRHGSTDLANATSLPPARVIKTCPDKRSPSSDLRDAEGPKNFSFSGLWMARGATRYQLDCPERLARRPAQPPA